MKWLQTFWFPPALGAVIFLAYIAPEWTLRHANLAGFIRAFSIVGIFFVSGLTLPTQVLRASLGHWRLHLFVQSFNLALIPALYVLIRWSLLRAGMDRSLADGLIILACVPTTIASSVALTAMAEGNEAGAICNSTLGNLIGVAVSPMLIYLLLSMRGTLDWFQVVRELSLLVVLPVLAGQICRLPFQRVLAANKKKLGILSQWLLLTVIYLVFASTFLRDMQSDVFSRAELAIVAAVVICSHLFLLAFNWRLTLLSFWRFNRADRIAALMCGTQKTVAFGIPLVAVLYDHDPVVGLITLPLLIYHPLQLLTGTLLAFLFKGSRA